MRGLALLALWAAGIALADPGLLPAMDAIRAAGCGGRPGLASPLRADTRLVAAARRLARGEGLEAALGAEGYRAVRAASIELTDFPDTRAMADDLARRSCGRLLDPALRDAGIARVGRAVWIVLAEPLATEALADVEGTRRRVVALVNEARARSRRCGSRAFAAAPALATSSVLSAVAVAHARDMAARDTLGHESADGAGPGERATRAGYAWRAVGENVASGATSADAVVRGWLGSPGHCANLMDPRFVETGIGYAVDLERAGGVYWAQIFAAPGTTP